MLFESELRNFESYEGGEGRRPPSGTRQQAADLNNKSSARRSRRKVNLQRGAGKFIMLVTSHARPVNTGHGADGLDEGRNKIIAMIVARLDS